MATAARGSLLEARDHEMSGDGLGSSGRQGDGERRRFTRGVPDGQNRVDHGRPNESRSGDLRCTGGPSHDGGWKLSPVQRHHELSRLDDADLERDLINADLTQIEGVWTQACDRAGSARRSVLREI